jgi:epoxide hydrolase-like predicted phosphatase
MTKFSAVLFDLGGVLTQPLTPLVIEAALATGLDLSGLQEVVRPMFVSEGDGDEAAHQMERGELSLDEFIEQVENGGTDGGTDHLGEVLRALFIPTSEHYVFQHFSPHPEMVSFVQSVQAAGYVTAVVSNVIAEWLPTWTKVLSESGLVFDELIMSCEVGLRKPNSAMYLHAVDRLGRFGVRPESALFIDDFSPMAAGAEKVGMTAVTLVDHHQAITDAGMLLGLSPIV